MVEGAPVFEEVGRNFLNYMTTKLDECGIEAPLGVLVAHNGNTFDFHFLMNKL